MKEFKLVKIKWLDHISTSVWCDIDELKKNFKPGRCETVGYLIENNHDFVLVAGELGLENTCSNITLILWSCIDSTEWID